MRRCPARPGSNVCVCGSWRGLYQRDRQANARQLTVRCPRPGSARVGSQLHGDQEAMTRPGPSGVRARTCAGTPTSAADPPIPPGD
jgi:hypothetical protein